MKLLPILASLALLSVSSTASPIMRHLIKRDAADTVASKVGIVLPPGSTVTDVPLELPGTDAPVAVPDVLKKLGVPADATAVPTELATDVPFPAWVTDPAAPVPTFTDVPAVTIPAFDDVPTDIVEAGPDGDVTVTVPSAMPTAFPDAGGDAGGEGAALPDGWGAIGGVEVPKPGDKVTVPADLVKPTKTVAATKTTDVADDEPTATATEGADDAGQAEVTEEAEEEPEEPQGTGVPVEEPEEPQETGAPVFEDDAHDVHDALLDALDSDVAKKLLPEITKLLKGSGALVV